MKSKKPYVHLTPEQHIAKYLRRKVVSKTFMKWMMGFKEGEEFISFPNGADYINAVQENTVAAWRKFSFHPGADQMMYGMCVQQGLLAVKGLALVVTKKTVDLLSDPVYRATLYGPRD